MKNNTSFLIVTATAVAAMALCFGSIADFGSGVAQNSAAIAKASAPVATPAADLTPRVE